MGMNRSGGKPTMEEKRLYPTGESAGILFVVYYHRRSACVCPARGTRQPKLPRPIDFRSPKGPEKPFCAKFPIRKIDGFPFSEKQVGADKTAV